MITRRLGNVTSRNSVSGRVKMSQNWSFKNAVHNMMERESAGAVFSPVPTPVVSRFSRLDLIFHTITFPLDYDGFGVM